MKKILTIVLASCLFLPLANKADEGMWIPSLLHKYNYADMQKKGLKITPEDIYSVNQSSLKDAIVLFGRGCTGEVVSDQGLMLTNHHCGYGRIQAHSSLEHDYLTDGFWAMSKEEELPNSGLKVTFLIRMEDVSDRILSKLNASMTEMERKTVVGLISKEIIEEATKGTHYEAEVKPLYAGNQYFLYVTEVYKDVRLVGAPPSTIGKFGGDTDNWMWPRHTGDFSVFRIYADKDNMPADYSEDNVPYKPKRHFTVSLKGVDKGDFTMVYGYPYTTHEYLPSFNVNMIANIEYPERIKLRQKKLDIIGAAMNADPGVRIQYASKQAGIANAWKKWIGVIRGLNNLNAIEKKQAFEKEFNTWAQQSPSGASYKNLLSAYKSTIDEITPLNYWGDYFDEAIRRLDIFRFAVKFRNLANPEGFEDIDSEVEKMFKATESFFKNYHQPTDKKIFTAMLEMIYNGIDPNQYPPYFQEISKEYNEDFQAYADWVYERSVFISKENMISFLEKYKTSKAKKIQSDPLFLLLADFNDYFVVNIQSEKKILQAQLDSLQRVYMAGQMQMQEDKLFYPDANATLRVTYGVINDYFPRDAVYYYYQTTLDGIIQKDNPDIYDYKVPEKLKELYKNKDYGRYGQNGTVNVCFTASNHTTGGNSGSPVLNAEGHLIGINFDRNWEGTMSDLMYDPDMCRNISIDIRYLLFVMDKFAGAGHLVDEMTIVE